MRTEDFDDEYHCFENDLRKVTTAYRQAKRKLEECFEHWSELGRDLLGGQVAVNFEHDVLTGSVSGRMFTLNLSPLVVGKENHVLVVLSVPDILNQEAIEIDRFTVSFNFMGLVTILALVMVCNYFLIVPIEVKRGPRILNPRT